MSSRNKGTNRSVVIDLDWFVISFMIPLKAITQNARYWHGFIEKGEGTATMFKNQYSTHRFQKKFLKFYDNFLILKSKVHIKWMKAININHKSYKIAFG